MAKFANCDYSYATSVKCSICSSTSPSGFSKVLGRLLLLILSILIMGLLGL